MKSIHQEYILIRQGRHPDYRFGSDRMHNASHFLFQNANELADFDSEGEFHPDSDEAIRAEARELIKP